MIYSGRRRSDRDADLVSKGGRIEVHVCLTFSSMSPISTSPSAVRWNVVASGAECPLLDIPTACSLSVTVLLVVEVRERELFRYMWFGLLVGAAVGDADAEPLPFPFPFPLQMASLGYTVKPF